MSTRWIVGAVILIGFLWIRSRLKALREVEGGSKKALYGIFFFLAPLLFVGKWAFGFLPFGPYQNLIVELLCLVAMFVLTGFLFLRGKPKTE